MKYLLTLFLLFSTPAFAGAPKPVAFVIAPAESSITFEAMQGTGAVKGGFAKFGADIFFHPDALAESKATVAIDTGSISIADAEAQDTAIKAEWIDITSFPHAMFVTDTITKTGEKTYDANGKLTLKGATVPVVLHFTLDNFSAKEAHITGEAVVKRRDFKIGWDDTKSVADEVKVFVNIKAIAK